MKDFIFLIAILFSLSFSKQILVFGDSWGTYGRQPFNDVMESHGHTVQNVAIGGTTAKGWAEDKYALRNVIDEYPETDYIWLTIGGNDAFPKMIVNQPIQEIIDQIIVDTRIFLDTLFEAYPKI